MEAAHSTHKTWYDRTYKFLLIPPVILFIISVAYLIHFYSLHGDFIYKDVTLTGGTTVTVFDDHADITLLHDTLRPRFPDSVVRGISNIRTGGQVGFTFQTQADAPVVKEALENYLGYALTEENSSIEFSGSSLSSGFYQQLRLAIILAFVFMAVVVFLIFRSFIPSAAVIIAAFADMVMTLAVVDFIGMRISTAGIIAFLMLIGYSVDTDILLTTRLLRKKEGNVLTRLKGAFVTGMTMTVAALAAVLVSLLIIYNFSDTLRQIFTIITIGLIFDVINTWLTNASMLRWYMEAKGLG